MIVLSVNGTVVEVPEGATILEAARKAGIYIPALCSHPDMKGFRSAELAERVYQGELVFENDPGATMESIKGCGVCVVEIEGRDIPVSSCKTPVENGMAVLTETDKVLQKRKQNLSVILSKHPHSCLTCSQREGCLTLSEDCSNSVPISERCCAINGNCELQRLSDYVGIAPETAKFKHPAIPVVEDGALFVRDYNLCIACGRCVRACQQLRGVFAMGAVINKGKFVVGTVNGPNLSEADCRFCGACVEVCPTGALQDKKKPKLKEFGDFVPCRKNCPGNTDIPAYLKFTSEGEYQKAAEVISSRLSFPHSLGKICFHPCEVECRRNDLSEALDNKPGALSIRLAKDAAMSRSELPPLELKAAPTGKNVAVIGAGPAGLTTGFYLSLKGHKVTVYEKEEKPGGMLRYGIPRYRLPEETLDKDLSRLMQSGMDVRTGSAIADAASLTSMLNNDYDAVYLAVGLSKSRRLPAPVVDHESVYYGVEFLNKVSKGEIAPGYFDNKTIAVIGGGNVATDAARTAVRLGAEKVKLVCLEKSEDMPAYADEIAEAKDEGIKIVNEWGISEIDLHETGLLNISLKKCVSVFDENGNFAPQYDESVNGTVPADAVILCIGQEADLNGLNSGELTGVFHRGLVKLSNGSTGTMINGLYAGGDIVSGPASVIDAVGRGKQAAREIDKYLGGDGVISGDNIAAISFDPHIGKIDGFCHFERVEVPLADPEIRKNNFEPVELGFTDEQAKTETARCLQCNIRMDIRQNPHPPAKYLPFTNESIENIPASEGVIQLLNNDKEVFLIKGSDNMKNTLLSFLDEGKQAAWFTFEEDQLFSKRESELIQQHLQKHGEMPDSGDDLDDLF